MIGFFVRYILSKIESRLEHIEKKVDIIPELKVKVYTLEKRIDKLEQTN